MTDTHTPHSIHQFRLMQPLSSAFCAVNRPNRFSPQASPCGSARAPTHVRVSMGCADRVVSQDRGSCAQSGAEDGIRCGDESARPVVGCAEPYQAGRHRHRDSPTNERHTRTCRGPRTGRQQSTFSNSLVLFQRKCMLFSGVFPGCHIPDILLPLANKQLTKFTRNIAFLVRRLYPSLPDTAEGFRIVEFQMQVAGGDDSFLFYFFFGRDVLELETVRSGGHRRVCGLSVR